MSIPLQKPIGRRIIIINGPGLGKSLIAKLLMAKYDQEGIPYKRFIFGSRRELAEALKTTKRFKGYVLIETNLILGIELKLAGLRPWQTITVEGGHFGRTTVRNAGKSLPECSSQHSPICREPQGTAPRR